MHAALQNQDVLQEIFSHLADDKPGCFNGALVCRTFEHPALDALWRCLAPSGILPLLMLLRNLRYLEMINGKKSYILRNPANSVSPHDLERLTYYGSRVHSIVCVHELKDQFMVEPEVYEILHDALESQNRLLVPNLEALSLDFQHPVETSLIFDLLFSPYLKKVSISACKSPSLTPEWTSKTCDLVQRLAEHKHPLVELVIDIPCPSSLIEIVRSADSFSSNLRSLKIVVAKDIGTSERGIGVAFLQHLARLNNLTSLFLEFWHLEFEPSNSIHTVCFDNITRLGLACRFEDLLTLFSTLEFPSLADLFIEFTTSAGAEDPPTNVDLNWVKLFKLVAHSTTPSNLVRLSIQPWDRLWSRGVEDQLDEVGFFLHYSGVPFDDIWEHLSKFRLTSFMLQIPILESLTMENLQSIVTTYPDLQDLYLHCGESHKTVGLDGLYLIADSLPKLRRLSIPIDITTEVANPCRDCHHGLELLILQLFTAPADEEESNDTAARLNSLFPTLNVFHQMDDVWDLVEVLVYKQTALSKMMVRTIEARTGIDKQVKLDLGWSLWELTLKMEMGMRW